MPPSKYKLTGLKAVRFLKSTFKAIIPTIVGFLLAYITFSKQFYSNEKGRLDTEFNKIFDYYFQYPYLLDSGFISRVNQENYSHIDSLHRYIAYCTYIFNYVQRECEY